MVHVRQVQWSGKTVKMPGPYFFLVHYDIVLVPFLPLDDCFWACGCTFSLIILDVFSGDDSVLTEPVKVWVGLVLFTVITSSGYFCHFRLHLWAS